MFLFADRETAEQVVDALRLLEGRLQGSGRRLTLGAIDLREMALRSLRGQERPGAARSGQPSAKPCERTQDQHVEQLLTLDEAAGLLAVSVRTLRRMVDAGQIPSVRIGRARRFRAADLEAATTTTPTHEAATASTGGP